MPEGGSTLVDDRASASTRRTTTTATTSPATAPVSSRRAVWRRAGLAFACAFAALLCIFIDTVLDLVDGWGRTGTFAHGYIIFPVSAWLVWRMRDQLAPLTPRVQPLALLPLIACGVLWLAGTSAGVHTPTSYAFVGMVPCIVWGVFGTAVTRRILFPLAFLVFAVPAGDFLMPTLMDHTADFTVAALRLSGVPVYREGNYFSIPSGNWSVVEACSGLRYLIASITLGCLFAYLNYRRTGRRIAFIAASVVVPIIANWLRAYMIVMIAHLSSNALATGVDHLIYGWLFFGLVMMLLFWVGNFWREDDPPVAPTAQALAERVSGRGTSGRAFVGIVALLVAVAAPWPAVASWLERVADAAHPGAIANVDVPGWTIAGDRFSTFVPHYEHPRSTLHTGYVSGDQRMSLFIAYYSGQNANGALVTYANDVVIVADKVWGSVSRTTATVDVAGQALPIVENQIKNDTANERLMTWRWYWINGRLTTNDYLAKAYTALDKLTGRGDDSAVIVVSSPIGTDGVDETRARIASFVKASEPLIQARLSGVRDEAHR